MYTISKSFSFCSSHQLDGLPASHPCSRLHGHNYEVVFVLEGTELNDVGFIRDYRELEPIKRYIDDVLDHRHLNDVLEGNPTAENIARTLFNLFHTQFPELAAVKVSETPKTWAEYRPAVRPAV